MNIDALKEHLASGGQLSRTEQEWLVDQMIAKSSKPVLMPGKPESKGQKDRLEAKLLKLAESGRGVVLRSHGTDGWEAVLQDRPKGVTLKRAFQETPFKALQAVEA